MQLDGLAGLRVLITAAATGIGRQVAATFAAAGAQPMICDHDAAALAASAAGPGCPARLCDVTDETAVDALFADVQARLGGLDALINCAGIGGPAAPLEQIEPADWRATLEVNLTATYLCCRRAIPLLRAAGGGSIVNLASTAGLYGYPLRSPYAAAKWAVIGLSKTLASELGGDGIRVNAIAPGAVEGARMDRVIANEAAARGCSQAEVRDDYVAGVSLKSFVSADDIAASIAFLCSTQGRMISGQVLTVDGNTETL